jgi:hypothetical protein
VRLKAWKVAATALAAVVAGGGGVLVGSQLGSRPPSRSEAGARTPAPWAGAGRGGPLFVTPAWTGVRPTSIVLSADGGNVPYDLRWSQWNDHAAVGKGLVGVESCDPDCAQGPTTPVPVRITLSGVRHGHYTYIAESISGMRDRTRGTGPITSSWPFGASSGRAPASGISAEPGTTVAAFLSGRASDQLAS